VAYENSIAAPPTPAHPMANPGYGKRSAPDQEPRRPGDFGHLPAREGNIAGFLDRLPEGAAMDAKTLAKKLPLYGQQAVRTALNQLSRAGHLRRVRRRADNGEGGTRWVFRTYWSRTARDSDWWARFLGGDVPVMESLSSDEWQDSAAGAAPADVPPPAELPQQQPGTPMVKPLTAEPSPDSNPQPNPPRPAPAQQPQNLSAAYDALARLGRTEPRLALSAADCTALQGMAADWLARGATSAYLLRTLTAGLPEYIHAPRAFVRRRLLDKVPPELPVQPDRSEVSEGSVPTPRGPRTIMECTECGVPGRPEALPEGLCRACRGGGVVGASPVLPPTTVRARAAQVRGTIRTPLRV
jgi:hypothetical protein